MSRWQNLKARLPPVRVLSAMPCFRALGGGISRSASLCVVALIVSACSRQLKTGTAQLEADPPAETAAAEAAPKDSWCGHLGSHRDGRSEEVLANANWEDQLPAELWKVAVGVGAAGVAVGEGRGYTLGNSGEQDTVVCLDIDSGAPIWSTSYPCSLDKRQFEGGPAVTPTLDLSGGSLFVLSHEGELRCLDVSDGSERWRKHLVDDFNGRRPNWGYSGAPLLANGLLIVEPGGDGSAVLALDPQTGAERWRAGSHKAGYSSPIAFPGAGARGVAVLSAVGLDAYALIDGAELFQHRWETSYDVNAPTPCYHAGHFFVCSGYGKGGGLLSAKDNKVELVYETRDAICQFQSPIRVGENLFLVTGDNSSKSRLNCMRFDSGELAWSEPLGGNHGGVIAIGDHLIVVTERGEAILCDASAEAFTERGRFQAAGGRVWAPPAFVGGLLFVRNNKGDLWAWDLR